MEKKKPGRKPMKDIDKMQGFHGVARGWQIKQLGGKLKVARLASQYIQKLAGKRK